MRPSAFMGDRHDVVNAEPGDPVAGTLLTWACPDNAVVQVVAVRVHFTTCADVADRLVEVYILDGGVTLPNTPAAITQPATKAWTYFFTMGIAPLDYTAETSEVYQPFGCCYQLETGSSLVVNANNIAPTDQIAAVKIRYFLWDRG